MSEPQWKYEDYSDWSRRLASLFTLAELKKKLGKLDASRGTLSDAHRRAIEATTSMSSQSQRRAHTRNSMVANYEEYTAVKNALEIHEYYPQYAKSI